LVDNHKPSPSPNLSLSSHVLKPAHDDAGEYDLSFSDGAGKYEYKGVRKPGDGQYALVFDPEKQHFVLHQVDSTFDMNLISTPRDDDPASLRESYPQIPSSSPKLRRKPTSQTKSKPAQTSRISTETKRRKVEKPKKAKTPPRKEPTPDAEDEDSDDGLTIEYPGGAPPPRYLSHPSPLPLRRINNERSEESDADAEYEEDDENERNRDVDLLKLPSPATNPGNAGVEHDADMEEEDVDLDLAAELEQALEKETKADESEISEEE
jgi:hypothetical protein